jgi:cyclopropane fatty-acyl-phospholipid synthase-like methyltransferase
VRTLELTDRFDRIVSIKDVRAQRNYERLLASSRAGSRRTALFVHIFAHRRYAYPFEDSGRADGGARFFTGGLMPSTHVSVQREARIARSGSSKLALRAHRRSWHDLLSSAPDDAARAPRV